MFKKTTKEKKPTFQERTIKAFQEFRAIGETFEYMGIKMKVTQHSRWIMDLGIMPEFKCDYVDKNGVLHSIEFSIDEIRALKSQENAL